MTVASAIRSVVGNEPPVRFEAYDGSALGATDARTRVVINNPEALARVVQSPGELGLARAYVAGDIDIDGDIFDLLELRHDFDVVRVRPAEVAALARLVGASALRRIPPPPEEHRPSHGRRHSRARDERAISHHYDVSNDFYRLVLGPTMTYSCAVWDDPEVGLDAAQEAKHALICEKLRLAPGQRLLDIGCGWGSMAMHAAEHHDVEVVGVTISRAQAEEAAKRVADRGLTDRVEIRLQDYRDVRDGPFDAISSIGMFEHVGLRRLGEYFDGAYELLRPGGRFMNHAIGRPARPARLGWLPARTHFRPRSFIERYVFPDGELHEIGATVSAMQLHGFEVRHVESLREHYALTLRAWLANLEASWSEAVAIAGPGRARVWRLYIAASAVGFEDGIIQVHQSLGVRPDSGRSHFSLRPSY